MLSRLCLQLIGITLLAWLCWNLPAPSESLPPIVKNALVGMGFIFLLGKVLVDTLFYERRP
jgi:hypothetical protein